MTGVPLWHAPLWQESPVVHALWSVHPVPFATGGFEHAPLVGLQEPTLWHGSDAVHVTAAPLMHAPLWQASPVVQALLSVQEVPFGAAGLEQEPELGSQTPATLHWPAAAQVTGFAPRQTPEAHASVSVQALPSSHDVPLGAGGVEHAPVLGSQVPARLHCPDARHTTGFEPVHVPASQASVMVQAFPSSQAVPFAAAGFEQIPVLGEHTPATWQVSTAVQTTPEQRLASDPSPSW